MSQVEGDSRALVVRVSNSLCALPLSWVLEIMRPLRVDAVAGAPAFVLGLSVVRGQPTPVVHLARLLSGREAGDITRFVAVRSGDRRLVFAVEGVHGVETLTTAALQNMPALLEKSSPEAIAAIGTLDQQLFLVLRETRILSEELEALLAGSEGAP